MPGFNQKGPDGVGAMTGRQGGMCRRTDSQPLANGFGAGGGRGRGMGTRCGQGQGLGQGRRFDKNAAQPQSGGAGRSSGGAGRSSREDLTNLKEQYSAARKTLDIIEQKIAALENGK